MAGSKPDPQVNVKTLLLDDIEGASYNPRTMTPAARAGLADSLNTFGLLDLLAVNEYAPGKYRLIGGHQRADALRAAGYNRVDCIVARLSPEEERLANITLNNREAQGRFDRHRLLPLLEELKGCGPALDDLVPREAPAPASRPEKVPKSPGPVQSTPGTVYALGRHRVLCGDATDPDTVNVLLGKRGRIGAILTRPHYTPLYISQDAQDDPGTAEAVAGALQVYARRMDGVGPAIVFAGPVSIGFIARALAGCGLTQCQALHWVKTTRDGKTERRTSALGDLVPASETALIAWRKGVRHVQGSDVILHPRQAGRAWEVPAPVMAQLVSLAGPPGTKVVDLFASSGASVLAAEVQERTCYAIEMDPALCDTIRLRWAETVHGPGADWQDLTPEAR